MTVKLLLKQIREQRGLSVNFLSRVTGLSSQYLSRLENGQHNPTLTTIDALCRSLRLQPGDLLVYEENSEELDYMFRYMPLHLLEAKCYDELRRLLSDKDFIDSAKQHTSIDWIVDPRMQPYLS